MVKTVYVGTCPQCGSRPTVYAIKRKNRTIRGIGCTDQSCRVETGFSYCTLDEVIRRWNNGISLERHGELFTCLNSPRSIIAMKVDI